MAHAHAPRTHTMNRLYALEWYSSSVLGSLEVLGCESIQGNPTSSLQPTLPCQNGKADNIRSKYFLGL